MRYQFQRVSHLTSLLHSFVTMYPFQLPEGGYGGGHVRRHETYVGGRAFPSFPWASVFCGVVRYVVLFILWAVDCIFRFIGNSGSSGGRYTLTRPHETFVVM